MMDPCRLDAKPLLTVDEALARIHAAIMPTQNSETIVIGEALGRVLSASLSAPINIPPDRNAAMDGYAFVSNDGVNGQPFTLEQVGTSWAGRPFEGRLQKGQCIRIFTGAVVPEPADSVVMQEQVEVHENRISFPAFVKTRQNIRAAGEDVAMGSLLCEQSKKLTAIDISLLAAAGIGEIPVKRSLKIIFFSTGDELTPLGQPLASGKIYDSNRYLLQGLLTENGYCVTDGGVLADDPKLFEDALTVAAKHADVIITTGGASVGAADYVKSTLERCGTVNFWKIAIKPGKPLAFGKIGQSYFFGLPGNPVAVLVTFWQIVAPALRQLAGEHSSKKLRLTAICTNSLKKSPGRQEFQRGILSQDEQGEFWVASSGKQGSHVLSSSSRANCFIILPNECAGVDVGEKVTVEPFGAFV